MRRYPMEKRFKEIILTAGLPVNDVLRCAKLPEGLFESQSPVVTAAEYFNLIKAVEGYHLPDEVILKLSTADQIETFSPPAFAAYCSKNAESCLKRMAEYESLFCGIDFVLNEDDNSFCLEIESMDRAYQVPRLLVLIKMIFLLHLIRKASNVNITPAGIIMKYPLDSTEVLQFFGCKVNFGEINQIVFRKKDMLLPFISENESIWSYFEPELNRRKQELDTDDSFSAEVRNVLVELLSNGECSVAAAAKRLDLSTRTMQRKLQTEGTNFQQQLNHTRELLAKNYIKDPKLGIEEIAERLGYQDVSSFQRAFTIWTGKSVSEYKKGGCE